MNIGKVYFQKLSDEKLQEAAIEIAEIGTSFAVTEPVRDIINEYRHITGQGFSEVMLFVQFAIMQEFIRRMIKLEK